MRKSTDAPVDLSPCFPSGDAIHAAELRGVSAIARGLVGSEILRIAAEITALQATGAKVCNLTVGDFSPKEFRIPQALASAIAAAYDAGETNYPPSNGILSLRKAVCALYAEQLGVTYPVDSVVIAGGARPVIYATYRAIVDPGETVLYTVPSWNNNHYTHLHDARHRVVALGLQTGFLPTAQLLAPHLEGVRLLCINSPLNPCGTVLDRDQVVAISELVVAENRRRAENGERSLYLMWDQVYWMLTFGGARHFLPPALVPAVAEWTIVVDGISKAFAATGLRVGWAAGPPHVIARMRDVLGHVGAWAPRPEQVATTALLGDEAAMGAFLESFQAAVRERLDLLHEGFQTMRRDGLPVDSVAPQGAIYLSARFDLIGRTVGGRRIETNDDLRALLLEEAGFALVPFQAFGLKEDTGWMRLSIGAVSPADIAAALPRVRAVLERCE